MGTVFNIAKEYVTTGTTTDPYLYTFPNNIMITIIYIILFKVFTIINVSDFLTVATVFNSLLVAGTGILLYYNTKKIFNNQKALMVLFITVFTTPLYLYCACYYSDTLSMFITMIMLAIFLKIKDKNNFKDTITWQILLAISMIIGIKVKITSIFIFIAIFTHTILNCKFNVKEFVKKFSITFLLSITLFISFNAIIEPLFIKDKQLLDSNKIPTEHWIMMGLYGRGYFEYGEYQYTQSFPTLEEKKAANRKVIKERLILKYQENTLFKHIKGKLGFAWYDGSYFIPDKLRREPVKRGVLHEVVLEGGNNTSIYKYLPQTMHFSMLIFMCINIYRVLKEKDYSCKDNILFIAIYGLLVFLLIWENRSRYLITMLPIIMMSQLNGIEYFAYRKDEKNEKSISSYTNVL